MTKFIRIVCSLLKILLNYKFWLNFICTSKPRETIKIRKINKIVGIKNGKINNLHSKKMRNFNTSNTVGREDFDPESANRLVLFEGKALPASVDKKSIDMDHDF